MPSKQLLYVFRRALSQKGAAVGPTLALVACMIFHLVPALCPRPFQLLPPPAPPSPHVLPLVPGNHALMSTPGHDSAPSATETGARATMGARGPGRFGAKKSDQIAEVERRSLRSHPARARSLLSRPVRSHSWEGVERGCHSACEHRCLTGGALARASRCDTECAAPRQARRSEMLARAAPLRARAAPTGRASTRRSVARARGRNEGLGEPVKDDGNVKVRRGAALLHNATPCVCLSPARAR